MSLGPEQQAPWLLTLALDSSALAEPLPLLTDRGSDNK